MMAMGKGIRPRYSASSEQRQGLAADSFANLAVRQELPICRDSLFVFTQQGNNDWGVNFEQVLCKDRWCY